MLLGEIIGLCVLFVVLPPIVWRLIYLTNKSKYDKFMAQVDALNKLQSTLNATLNGMLSNSTPTAELIKKVKLKKSKILDKFDALIELISSRTGVPIIHEEIIDTYLQEKIKIKFLDEEEIKGRDDIIEDFMFLKRVTLELIKENKFPYHQILIV